MNDDYRLITQLENEIEPSLLVLNTSNMDNNEFHLINQRLLEFPSEPVSDPVELRREMWKKPDLSKPIRDSSRTRNNVEQQMQHERAKLMSLFLRVQHTPHLELPATRRMIDPLVNAYSAAASKNAPGRRYRLILRELDKQLVAAKCAADMELKAIGVLNFQEWLRSHPVPELEGLDWLGKEVKSRKRSGQEEEATTESSMTSDEEPVASTLLAGQSLLQPREPMAPPAPRSAIVKLDSYFKNDKPRD